MPNKAQFTEALATRLGEDKKRAAIVLDAVLDTIYENIAKGERVTLTGFGIFSRRDRAARTARNPATGASVRVKKTSVPVFRAGAEFKAIASGAKKVAKAPAKSAAKATRSTSKTAAKKAPAKKAATRAPAKKSTAKSAPAKKSTTRKAASKRS